MGRLTCNGGAVWHANHQGPGTGMNADLVDGVDSPAMINSDLRKKRDIERITNPMPVEDIFAMIRAYRYRQEDDPQRYGVIAQDVQVTPPLKELVRTSGDGLSIEPTSMLFYFINSLAAELIAAKAEIATLKEALDK